MKQKIRGLKWHKFYIGALYVVGTLSCLGILSYFANFAQFEALTGVTLASPGIYSEYLSLMSWSMVIQIIRVILLFVTAYYLKHFRIAGYMYNISLHISSVLAAFFTGLINYYSFDDSGSMYIVGFLSAGIMTVAISLPILLYYYKRKDFFADDESQQSDEVVLALMPTDIVNRCKSQLYNSEELGAFIERCTYDKLITQRQADVLQKTYCLDNAVTVQVVNDHTLTNVNKICYCRKCGNRLIDDSRFCNKCGTEIADMMQN